MFRFWLFFVLLWCSFSANSAIITTGSLEYNDETGVITDTASGTSYLGWDILSSKTTSATLTEETLLATQAGGMYEGYHIASQSEAFDFYYAAGGTEDLSTAPDNFVTDINALNDEIFGENHSSEESYKYFLSDVDGEVGVLGIWKYDFGLVIDWDEGEAKRVDGSAESGFSLGWLLVSNSPSVPEPSTALLFLIGLLPFFRRSFINQK